MHAFRAFWLAAALAGVTAPASPAQDRPSNRRADTSPIDLPGGSRVVFLDVESRALGGTGRFSIFLPPSYGSGEGDYPAVYFLHGMFNDHTTWTLERHGDLPAKLDRLMQEGALPEMVLVHPDGGQSFYTNDRGGGPRYEDFVVEDLPRHVESTYRVRNDGRRRAIAGTSMGGYGALKIAMKHPDRYAAVAAHSPIVFPMRNPLELAGGASGGRGAAFLTEVFGRAFGDPFDQEYFDANNPLVLARERDLRGLAIYFDYGTADRYDARVGMGEGLALLDRALSEAGVEHVFRTHPGEPHGWQLVYDHVQESLGFLAEHVVAKKAAK